MPTRILTTFLLILFCASVALAEPVRSHPKVLVTDEEGAAISSAQVNIHWDRSGSEVGLTDNIGIDHDIVLRTNREGIAEASIPTGFYDFFIAAMAFSPNCLKVRLKGNGPMVVKVTGNSLISPVAGRGFGQAA
jgi:hypothetical protein